MLTQITLINIKIDINTAIITPKTVFVTGCLTLSEVVVVRHMQYY